jgi:2-methylcitrate dehydratase PrpD
MENVTDSFISLATGAKYENIPVNALHETKRVLLDSLGCALGGIASDKGKIGVSMAKKMGGVPESTLVGVGGRYSAGVAAFANSELMNGLDMDTIGHIPPVVLPALLAVAEARNCSGKEFMVAAVVAQEISARLGKGLSTMMASLAKRGTTPDVFGNSNENIIGAAVGCAMLMGLSPEKIGQALGISAYLCSLPVCKDWESTLPKAMIKYAPTAWLAQGAVQAAMLAEEGYTLDSEYGFPTIYTHGESVWSPDKVLPGLGEEWWFNNYYYKPYPCCRFIHSILDCYYQLQDKYSFNPEEISEIRCQSDSFVAHPDQYAVENQIDAQFSIPYSIAMAAFGFKIGPAWQDKSALKDPRVRSFMKKVTIFVSPKVKEMRKINGKSFYGAVEIDARGKTFNAETNYSRGTDMEGYKMTDNDLISKFKTNSGTILFDERIDKAVDTIMNLEKLSNINDMTRFITL